MRFSSTLFVARRSAIYYRKIGMVVALGLALAGAIMTGSLIIGDCVKNSIHRITTSRIGSITHAVTIPMYGRTQLAEELSKSLDGGEGASACSIIIAKCFVENQSSGATVPNAQLIGIDDRFIDFYKDKFHLNEDEALVNTALARDLSLKNGNSVLITVDKESAISTESLFAHIGPTQNQRSMRAEVVGILADDGPGGFRLDTSTQTPRNVFVPISGLADLIGKEGSANTILLNSTSTAAQISDKLHMVSTAQDYGLSITKNETDHSLIVKSDSISIPLLTLQGISRFANSINSEMRESSVYLADKLVLNTKDKKELRYAVIASTLPQPHYNFKLGGPIVSENQIILNSWAAEDLEAKIGDKISLEYLVSQANGEYSRKSVPLTLQGIVNISGYAADYSIVPEFDGITDAERIGDWAPSFPVDLTEVTKRDDQYWEKYKALPKAFLYPETLKNIWLSASVLPDDWLTSVQLPIEKNMNLSDAYLLALREIAQQQTLPPGKVSSIKETAVTAAEGNTDLAEVFLGLGILLIYASAALSGSIIRIYVNYRAKNIGIMLAGGYSKRDITSIMFAEWSIWTVGGALLAVPLGLLYAWLVVIALNSWWQGAVGQTALFLYIKPITLVYGFFTALLIGVFTVIVSLRGTFKQQVVGLLRGDNTNLRQDVQPKRFSNNWTVWLGAVLVLASSAISAIRAEYGIILALPVSIFASMLFSSSIIDLVQNRTNGLSLLNIAAKKHMSKLRYDAALQLAVAAVMLLVVSSQFRSVAKVDFNSGTGGFALRAISSLPLGYDLATPNGRHSLGFQEEDERLFENTLVCSLTAADGDDISCLNLAKPTQPRILGAPSEFVERGGFGLNASAWADFGERSGEIPAIGDADSISWNLKKKIGDRIEVVNDQNKSTYLTIRYAIKQSIFAGELVIPKKDFNALFPNKTQPRYYLIECPKDNAKALAEVLRQTLGSSGLQVESTTEVVNSFLGVQNTYIAVFMALGGLALILGAGGQLIGVMRSVYQHKSEYALLLSIGYTRLDIVRLLVIEHTVIPGLTVLAAVVSCTVILLPSWVSGQSVPNWLWLAVVLPIMAVVGFSTCMLSAFKASRGNLIEGLRTE